MAQERFHRRSIRLAGHCYTTPGPYFVTICTHTRWQGLRRLAQGRLELTLPGKIVTEVWDAIPQHCPGVAVDAFVVMPDHVHGVIMLPERRARRTDSSRQPFVAAGSLGAVVRSFKSASARRVRLECPWSPRLWQRNYHESIIRNARALEAVRRYIVANPAVWIQQRVAKARHPVPNERRVQPRRVQ